MPTYLHKTPAGYLFRRVVPLPLRSEIGKREIKVSLGANYAQACRRANEEAVKSDQLFAQARNKLNWRQNRVSDFYENLTPITELTEDLKQQLQSYWLSVVDVADLERRATAKAPDSAQEQATFRADSQAMLETLKTAWQDGNVEPLLPALHTTLMTRGYRLDMDIDDQRRLCLQFLRSVLAGYRLLEARDQGEDPSLNFPAESLPLAANAVTAKLHKGLSSPTPKNTTLYSLFEYWRDFGTPRSQKTIDDVERRIRDLDTLTKHKPAHQIVKADLITYRDSRIKAGVALSTVDKDISFLKTVFNFAFESDKLPTNPSAGVKVPKNMMPAPQRDLDTDDLKKLFGSSIYTQAQRPKGGAEDAAAWLPLMALYTGARLEELSQLTLADIRTEATIPYLRILDLDDAQEKQVKRLKNEGSRREIPIPQKLIDHGFLKYVEHLRNQKAIWLFPSLTVESKYGRRGANWSKWWGRWRHDLEVAGRHKCFHAFRHVFKTACRGAGIGEDIHDAITGHAKDHEGRKYGKFPLAALHQAIDKVSYPELTLNWVWQPTVKGEKQALTKASL